MSKQRGGPGTISAVLIRLFSLCRSLDLTVELTAHI